MALASAWALSKAGKMPSFRARVSKAASTSIFVKALNVIITGAKMAAPMVGLPAISVPALSAFTQTLSYWEDRTRFLMSGNLTTAVATQQSMDDPDREDHYIGLVSGEYLMLPIRHTDELAKELPNLDMVQGYLVPKDADPNVPLQTRAESVVPGVTYATMKVSVQPLPASYTSKTESAAKATATTAGGSTCTCPSEAPKKKK